MAMNRSFFLFLHLSIYLKNITKPRTRQLQKKKTHQHTNIFGFFFLHLFCWFLFCFTNPQIRSWGNFPKNPSGGPLSHGCLEDSRKPEVRDLLEFGKPGKSGWGPGMERWCNLGVGTWYWLVGWVGLGWVGWLVKMLGAVVVFFWLKWWSWSLPRLPLSFWCLKCVFFLMFFGHRFRVCWSLFFQPKKSPEKDDLKFRHQNVGEF